MKSFLSLLAVSLLALGLVATGAEARRLGGGASSGQQRSSPAMREVPKQAPAAAPAPTQPTQANPAAAPSPTPQPQPSFMGRWGGMLAGFGLGALLGSMFGGSMGAGLFGGLLSLLLIGGVVFMLIRFLASRGSAPARNLEYAGMGNAAPAREPMIFPGSTSQAALPAAGPPLDAVPNVPPGFQVEPFLRAAKTAFIRLQAANDAKDLDDIRDYTTPEMYAELAMQIRERGDAPQKTEVVTLDAKLLEAVVEGDYAIASVRYSGLIRETEGANADSFDEIWHVRKKTTDPKATWLIAGIQQVA